ncbi:MAG: drug resistance transporter, EmrB/QacA family [Labilithrix sp.]|nr:drug resistance transporter, EmrB/QacA family [Labilithrix sp.]
MSSPRTTHRPATVAALLLALFMAAMEMTVVSTAMPTVVAELGGALHYAWVFTAYMLTSTVTVPIYGKLADLHGRKPVMLVAMALFLLGSMASGQARTMGQLIVFRAIQGVGAGGMQPMALTIVGDIFKIEERAKMQGVFGAVWAIAGLVGPLLGGVIVATLSWRWVFYVNVPFGLVSAAVISVALVENIEKREHRLDVLGAIVLAAAVVALLLGADGEWPWVLLPASAVLTAAFLWVETRASEPILPLSLFAQRILATSSALSALGGASMLGVVTFVPLYAQGVLGSTPTQAGSTIATMAVAWPLASAISGRLIAKIGFRTLVRGGFLIVAVASLWLTLAMADGASTTTLRLGSALLGLGMGFANTPLVIAVQTSVGFSQRGVATASTMFFRNIGGTLALGVMGVVLARALLAGAGTGLVARILGPERRSVDPSVLTSISGDLTLGISRVMWIVTGLAVAAAAVAWAFPHVATQDRNQGPPPELTAARTKDGRRN